MKQKLERALEMLAVLEARGDEVSRHHAMVAAGEVRAALAQLGQVAAPAKAKRKK